MNVVNEKRKFHLHHVTEPRDQDHHIQSQIVWKERRQRLNIVHVDLTLLQKNQIKYSPTIRRLLGIIKFSSDKTAVIRSYVPGETN